MITPIQRGLLKRAQADARIGDAEYRDHIATVTGLDDCRSSTDPRLSNDHLDRLLALFEAIYWRQLDGGDPVRIPSRAFRARGYWAGRNTRANTTRDRYTARELAREIGEAEDHLQTLGKAPAYLDAIRQRTGPGRAYLAALRRTTNAILSHATA